MATAHPTFELVLTGGSTPHEFTAFVPAAISDSGGDSDPAATHTFP